MAEPPAPKAILRGHKAQVHAASFIRQNERLITGDAEGYVVLWDLTVMRPRAVWRPHESAILGVKGWGQDRIITHGRDNKLIVWKLGLEDEERLSTSLPLEDVPMSRPQPWVLHLLPVNTMNFCSFSACGSDPSHKSLELETSSDILVAVPNTLASEAIDVYSLPSQSRIHTIKTNQGNGMAMSLSLFHHQGSLTLLAAFENGFTSVHALGRNGQWTTNYRSQAHAQPILSLDVHPDRDYFITSSADSIVAKHPIPTALQEVAVFNPNERIVEVDAENDQELPFVSASSEQSPPQGAHRATNSTFKAWEHPLKVVNTKHSGQQSLRIRSDGRIFATAGWDSNIRMYAAKTMKELAVLQWHKVGCYAVAFSDVSVSEGTPEPASAAQGAPSTQTAMIPSTTVRERRLQKAKTAHWVAAGAKDGKVSLWDIY